MICLVIVILLSSTLTRGENLVSTQKQNDLTVLEVLQNTQIWFVSYEESQSAKKHGYFKFNNDLTREPFFENYLKWKNEDCYWRVEFDEMSYSVRKSNKEELVIIHNLGGDDYRELRFVKNGDTIVYTLGEYLNGELAVPISFSIMYKVIELPVDICNK